MSNVGSSPSLPEGSVKLKIDVDGEHVIKEGTIKPFSNTINKEIVCIKEENKDTIFKAFKCEVNEFEKFIGNGIKPFNDFKPKKEEIEDSDSDVEIIKEIKDDWVKIERAEKSVAKKNYVYKRSPNVHDLISTNKELTINLNKPTKVYLKPPTRNKNIHNFISFKNKVNNTSKNIKVKDPQALGINKQNVSITGEDCRTSLLRCEQLYNNESKVTKICLLVNHYFNNSSELQLNCVITILRSVLKELRDSREVLSDLSKQKVTMEDMIMDHESCTYVLKKYSKDFFDKFCAIVDVFEKEHKKSMIPVIYIMLLRETVTSLKLEDVRSIIIKLLMLENYSSEYDMIFTKNHIDSFKVFKIYERWLDKYSNWTKAIDFNDSINTVNKISACDLVSSEGIEGEYDLINSSCIYENGSVGVVRNCNTVSSENHFDDNVDYKKQTSNVRPQSQGLHGSLEDKGKQTTEKSEYQGSVHYYQDCPNEECNNKLTVPCCFCLELCSCPDFCQVENKQLQKDAYISCREHQSFFSFWSDAHTTAWRRIRKDHEMPYEPVCWRRRCGKKALIICVCKTRAYCDFKCKKEDWYSTHHKTCTGHTHPSLFYNNTC